MIATPMLTATDTLTKTFAAAQQEARRLNQDFVGTEHLAVALLDGDDSEAGRVLRLMNVEGGYIRNALAQTLPTGTEPPVVTGDLPMSPKAQRLVTNAIVAAQAAGRAKVSTRFLLAALLAEAAGVVCESFRRGGVDAGELVKALRTRDVTEET
jgi:ATP-dependent Clp protease ATP-binding subunit ClpC